MVSSLSASVEREILLFERKHMLGTLLFVYDRGGCTRMELYKNVANNDGMPGKLAVLEKHGLIVQKEVPITRAMRIDITEKGKEVVEHLLSIEKLISDESDS